MYLPVLTTKHKEDKADKLNRAVIHATLVFLSVNECSVITVIL